MFKQWTRGFLALGWLSVLLSLPAQGAQEQVIPGHREAAWARLQPIGRLAATNRLHLAIGLPLRHLPALTRLVEEIYRPGNTNYHRYLTPEQFTRRFGPTEQDYRATRNFFEAQGFAVTGTHANRMLLDVTGSVGDIEKTFHLHLRVYRHANEAGTFYGPDADPSVALNVPILHVSGLNNETVPQPKNLQEIVYPRAGAAVPRMGSGPGGSFMGQDFRKAYASDVSLTGTGQTVALFELDGYYATDIASYQTQAGLPNVPVEKVLIDGFSGNPTSRRLGSGNEEVALDLEMTMSMAPGLSRVLVYEGSPGGTLATFDDILNRIATDNLAKQIACSWGFDIDATSHQIFLQYAAQGQSFFLASGDSGAFTGPVSQPADNPYITVVGGTALTTSGSQAWASEGAWNGSGGGISTLYSIPVWQQGLDMSLNKGSTAMRNTPDVSMIASNAWVIADSGRSFPVDGTSIATPLWAAFTALVNQQAAADGKPSVGFLNPALYAVGKSSSYSKAFHDITRGNNVNSASPNRFFSTSGYDLVTGWGSPKGQEMIKALLSPLPKGFTLAPQVGYVAFGPVGGPFNISSRTYALRNTGSTPVTWSATNKADWLTVSPKSGTLEPGGPATMVTIGLNATATNLLIGNFDADVVFANSGDSAVQSIHFSLLAGNGGFELGDTSDWVFTGLSILNFADSIDASQINGASTIPGIDDALFVHSGIYGMFLGQAATLGSLSQSIPTTAGHSYRLSFWLDNPAAGVPNQFRAAWNGTALYDQANLPQFAWTNLVYVVNANGTHSDLQFQFRNDNNAFGLDDIRVEPLASPFFQSIVLDHGIVTFAWKAQAGLRYQVQYTTNLQSPVWNNLGAPAPATSGVAKASDVVDSSLPRFYRIALTPSQ